MFRHAQKNRLVGRGLAHPKSGESVTARLQADTASRSIKKRALKKEKEQRQKRLEEELSARIDVPKDETKKVTKVRVLEGARKHVLTTVCWEC